VAYPVSWIKADRNYVLVNKHGYELNPADVVISGEMSTDRVARMLPIDYKPNLIPKISEEVSLSHFQENIYVHTDKPYYYPGEAIWFKGYINYATPLWRDSLSRTVYVELINPNDKLIKSKILKIDSGFFHNDFLLPDTLTAGAYHLRAYTNFSRNFGDSVLYVKPIPILHITDKVNLNIEKGTDEEDNPISITTDKVKYKPREKITISLKVKDEDGNPMSSNLSISVTDATQVVPVTTSSTILEGFPLKEIQAKSDKYAIAYPIEYGINFRGQLFDNKNKPSKEALLNVIQINPRNLIITQSNKNGFFAVSNLDFYDITEFSIQSNGDKGKAFGKIDLISREIPSMKFTHPKYRLSTIESETPQRIISEYEVPKGDRLLQEVIVTGQKITEEKDVRTYGKPDYVLKAKDLNSAYGNLLLTLPGKIPGLLIREVNNPNGIETVVYINRLGTAERSPKDLLVMIDDAPIGGKAADILAAIDPRTIETIEVKTGISGTGVLHGSRGAFGVISVYTKKDISIEGNDKRIRNFQTIEIEGYSLSRTFKSPEYNKAETDSTKADYRSTLYWNPEVIANRKTLISIISFFASDLIGSYRVIVEGVTQKGKPVRGEYSFFVGD
jgi:TonB-dependent Receptor Plug Domain